MRALLPVRDYALGETLSSGQTFRWHPVNGVWEGVVARRWVKLSPEAGGIRAETSEAVQDWRWLIEYLQTETDLQQVIATFPKDEHMRKAVLECPGLRLLKQEPWECLASFILSS